MRRRGFTILELVVSLGIFGIIGLIFAVSLSGAADAWRNVSGSSDSQISLTKARNQLVRDLETTSFETVNVATGLTSLGFQDGTLIWFLSAEDPVTGEFMRTSTGTPFWQRNVLYYTAVPTNHGALFGLVCSGGGDANGFEVQCPHKVLVRKVVDGGGVTDPTDESTIELPLTPAEAVTYLSRPSGFDTTGMMGEPGITEVTLPSTNLLSMQVQLAPDLEWPNEVRVNLSSVALLNAQREVAIGKTPLNESRFTTNVELQVFPGLP